MMTENNLAQIAERFRADTGMEPQEYNQSAGKPLEDRCRAIRADIEWFRRHTEAIHRRLSHAYTVSFS